MRLTTKINDEATVATAPHSSLSDIYDTVYIYTKEGQDPFVLVVENHHRQQARSLHAKHVEILKLKYGLIDPKDSYLKRKVKEIYEKIVYRLRRSFSRFR